MKTNTRLTISAMIIALMLAACSTGLSAPLPQEPTATAAPPTATAAPTERPTVDENTGTGNEEDTALGAALMKFGSAKSYRAQMEMKGKGALGISTDDNSPNSPDTSLFVLTGDFKGSDGHYTLKGFLSSLMGVEPDAGLEAMLVGGKAYIHGPVSLLGAAEDKWYVLEGEESQAIVPPFQVNDFLSALGNSDVQLGSFKAAGSESVDGKKCNILSGDKTEAAKALTALNAGALPGVADLTSIDAATAKFSLCDDGYIHRIELTLDTSSKDKADTKASFSIDIHMFDFDNAAIAITAPKNPLALNPSDVIEGTATPSK